MQRCVEISAGCVRVFYVHIHVRVLDEKKSPKHAEKSPKHTQKSPKHTQKSPKHTQKSPKHTQKIPIYERCLEAVCSMQKPVYKDYCCVCTCILCSYTRMGWLRVVGSLKI